jgi:hypothetical protein
MTYRPLLVLLLLFSAAACRPTRSPAEIARDKDGDGIANDLDACPTDRETVNRHNDQDGCPDRRLRKRGVLVPGAVVAGLGLPLIGMGAAWTSIGLSSYDDPDPMHAGFEEVGVPLLVAGIVHEAIGIPLIVAGASASWWSDEPGADAPSGVRPEISARGVGVRY